MNDPTGGGFSIDPQGVSDAGKHAEDCAQQLGNDRPVLAASVDQALSGVQGMQVHDALAMCTDTWGSVNIRLTTVMDQQGRNLKDTAKAHQQNEREVEGSLRCIAPIRP